MTLDRSRPFCSAVKRLAGPSLSTHSTRLAVRIVSDFPSVIREITGLPGTRGLYSAQNFLDYSWIEITGVRITEGLLYCGKIRLSFHAGKSKIFWSVTSL